MIGLLYKNALKPLLFMLDAEFVHDMMTNVGEFLGSFTGTKSLTRRMFKFGDKRLVQRIKGIEFANPIGLAAGFDYDARLTQITPDVGFGFHTIGSITYGSYEGNKKPRLGRLPKSKSLLVNKGLKSKGVRAVLEYLKKKNTRYEIPIGVSIAKTNSTKSSNLRGGITDYCDSFKEWEKTGKDIGDFYELNISCPNAFGGEPYTTPGRLRPLLKAVTTLRLKKPLFVKMPIELSNAEALKLLALCVEYKVAGVIFGNLAKDRSNPALNKEELKGIGKGNFSGKPTWEKSNNLIALTYKTYGKKLIIIGCGGVFNAEDAYHKIKLGASLVQMITGMIYEGPQAIGEINEGLVKLLKRDKYKNISEAIGKNTV